MKNYWIQRSPFSKIHSHRYLWYVLGVGLTHWKSHPTSSNYKVIDAIDPPVGAEDLTVYERFVHIWGGLSSRIMFRHSVKLDWIAMHPNMTALLPSAAKILRQKKHGLIAYWGKAISDKVGVYTIDDFPENFIFTGHGSKAMPTLGYYAGIRFENLVL